MLRTKFLAHQYRQRRKTFAIKKIEWTIDAKSLPKQKSSKDSMAAIYIDYLGYSLKKIHLNSWQRLINKTMLR